MSITAAIPQIGRGVVSDPLLKQLRPRTLDDFIGNEFELAALKPGGSVIFTGPWGCGKTSAACAHAAAIFGAPVAIREDYQEWCRRQGGLSTFVHYLNLDAASALQVFCASMS